MDNQPSTKAALLFAKVARYNAGIRNSISGDNKKDVKVDMPARFGYVTDVIEAAVRTFLTHCVNFD